MYPQGAVVGVLLVLIMLWAMSRLDITSKSKRAALDAVRRMDPLRAPWTRVHRHRRARRRNQELRPAS
jgi:hypothetical protein